MNLSVRELTIEEAQKRVNLLTYISVATTTLALVTGLAFVNQSKIIVEQVPGLNNVEIGQNFMDLAGQQAIIMAFTKSLAEINPANAEYQKRYIKAFLAPELYTQAALEIDALVAKQATDRALGSYYFTVKNYDYDPQLRKHFVVGAVHTVNAAKDTSEPWVFTYTMRIEDYRPVITSIERERGETIKNTAWIQNQEKAK